MKILFLILIFIPTFGFGMEVWFTSQEPLSAEQSRSIIRGLPEELKELDIQTFADNKLQNPFSEKQKEEIQNTILDAQNEELSRNYIFAIKRNEEALRLLEKQANILGFDKITFSVFIKLAELYEIKGDKEKAKAFWNKAYAWDTKAVLNKEIFSSKIIKKFKQIKSREKKTLIKIKAPLVAHVFLNGKKPKLHEGKFEAEVFPGKHQIAVLIPGSPWQIENLILNKAAAKPYVFTFKPRPIISGTSQNPALDDFKLPSGKRLISYFNKEERFAVFDGASWYDLKGNLIAGASENKETKLIGETSVKKNNWFQKLTKSPWFWVGVGTVAGTVIILKGQESGAIPQFVF